MYSNINSHAPFSVVVYVAADVNYAGYRSPTVFYGYKAGIESAGIPFGFGIELRNSTDFAGKDQFVFTPKAGLSLFGHANLYYGYNIFDRSTNTFGISYSQLTFNVNINRKMFKERLTPGKGSTEIR